MSGRLVRRSLVNDTFAFYDIRCGLLLRDRAASHEQFLRLVIFGLCVREDRHLYASAITCVGADQPGSLEEEHHYGGTRQLHIEVLHVQLGVTSIESCREYLLISLAAEGGREGVVVIVLLNIKAC